MTALALDRNNLTQFTRVMNRAYAAAKNQGLIPVDQISIYDNLIAAGPVYQGQDNRGGWVQPIQTHRIWRNRVARLYWRENGRPLRGLAAWDMDWDEIMAWITENILPILKMLFVILPFII